MSSYAKGLEKMKVKKYAEAIKCFEEEIKKKKSSQYIAYGALGYCQYKCKQFTNARRTFEKNDFLLASKENDFEQYITIWAATCYNLTRFNDFESIIIRLQNHKIGSKNIVDKDGKNFDDEHPLIKFLQALVEWKKEVNLYKAQELLKDSPYEISKNFLEQIEKDLKKLIGEITYSISIMKGDILISINVGKDQIKTGTPENLKEATTLFQSFENYNNISEYVKAKKFLAISKMRLNDIEGCLTTYENLIEFLKLKASNSKKEISDIYLEMAKVCLKSKKKEYADRIKIFLEKAKTTFPMNQEINYIYGDYYNFIGDAKKAFESFNRYKGTTGTEDFILDSKIYYARLEMESSTTPGEEEFEDINNLKKPEESKSNSYFLLSHPQTHNP